MGEDKQLICFPVSIYFWNQSWNIERRGCTQAEFGTLKSDFPLSTLIRGSAIIFISGKVISYIRIKTCSKNIRVRHHAQSIETKIMRQTWLTDYIGGIQQVFRTT